jgi:single-stranded-DNA-specific exonuclease
MIQDDPSLQQKNTNVLFNPTWHKGVVGIVASRVIEQFYKPTIILTQSDGEIIGGSVRSVKGFDVYKALEQCTNEMIQFGGHKYAAGLTLKKSQLGNFSDKFEQVVTEQMGVEKFIPSILYEAELSLNQISRKLKSLIDKLEPFGPQNMTPTFVSRGLIDGGDSRAVGADKSHLKLDLLDPKTGIKVPGIAFGCGVLESNLKNGDAFDIAYSIDINFWKNRETIQLMVKDIQLINTK